MFYPYCSINDTIEVVHTPIRDGKTLVHFEEPDEVFGFKTLDCLVPTYQVSNIIGFNQSEVSDLVSFCQNNAHLLLASAKQGGIANT